MTLPQQQDQQSYPASTEEWRKYANTFHPFKPCDWEMLAVVLDRTLKRQRKSSTTTNALRIQNYANIAKAPHHDEPAVERVTRWKYWLEVTEQLKNKWLICYSRRGNFITVIITDGMAIWSGTAKRMSRDEFNYVTGYFTALRQAFLAAPVEVPAILGWKHSQQERQQTGALTASKQALTAGQQ